MVNLLPKAIPSLAINGLEFLQNWWLLALGLACLVGGLEQPWALHLPAGAAVPC